MEEIDRIENSIVLHQGTIMNLEKIKKAVEESALVRLFRTIFRKTKT